MIMPPLVKAYFDPQPGFRVPSSFELAEVLDRILGQWAYLSAVPSGKPSAGPVPFALEFSVRLCGPVNGCLNLRASRAFAEDLAFAATGDLNAAGDAEDAFQELCNLLASQLIRDFFGGTHETFERFLPMPSTPGIWPVENPNSECLALIEKHPLEIRLWIELAARERA